MIIANTTRKTKRNSRTRLSKVQERRVVRIYMKAVSESLLNGFRFDFPNKFGTMAITQKEKSVVGKSASRNIASTKIFEDVKQLSYKGAITDGGSIKFIPSQNISSLARKQKMDYRSEIIIQ